MTFPSFAPLVLVLAAIGFGVLGAIRWRARRMATVEAWEIGLLYRDGVFQRELPPGRYFLGLRPARLDRVANYRRQAVTPVQEVLTADGFPVKLGAVADWRIAAARTYFEQTLNSGEGRLLVAVQLALRGLALTRTLDELLAARAGLAEGLRDEVQAAVAPVGIQVETLALRDLILPAEVRRMVTEPERARREGLAALERARGEQAALRALGNAARLLRGNPELAQLRVLQSLQAAPGRPAPTLVLGGTAVLASGPATPEPAPPPPPPEDA